jgi:hypothetical protein
MMTTYENLGPTRRWWFFLLAGHAARELLDDLDRLDEPLDAPVLTSPYTVPGAARPPRALAAPRTPLALAPTPAVRPQPTYPDSKRRAVCQGLRQDWSALADRVGIPAADRSRFAVGAKPQGVWDWLDGRGRLGELPAALRSLGLNQLADILDS